MDGSWGSKYYINLFKKFLESVETNMVVWNGRKSIHPVLKHPTRTAHRGVGFIVC